MLEIEVVVIGVVGWEEFVGAGVVLSARTADLVFGHSLVEEYLVCWMRVDDVRGQMGD